ncbi:MAG: outer membrane lipid asymmetry maintenance protein MlaD [Alphaproteobacteria bacterium]|nr:outer membrane lipid asymmetry maintenance protein MlaD [Alphaproteobacteria bacterium]
MKRNIIETVLGAVVLLVAGVFLLYSTTATKAGAVSGYEITVRFNEIGGLKQGNDVRIGGVKIGSVKSIDLGDDYRAKVTLSIKDDVKIPEDTAARVSSESLMGGAYVALDVGGDEQNIRPGGSIKYAQDAQNLEQLLGKFIFSQAEKNKDADDTGATPPAAAAPAAPQGALPQM